MLSKHALLGALVALSLVGCGGSGGGGGADTFGLPVDGTYSGSYRNIDESGKLGNVTVEVSGSSVVVDLVKTATNETGHIDGTFDGSGNFSGSGTDGADSITASGTVTLRNGKTLLGNWQVTGPTSGHITITADKE